MGVGRRDRIRDDIKEKGLSREEVYDRAGGVCHCESTTHKSGNKMKKITARGCA